MSAEVIGSVQSGTGKRYDVKWDPMSKQVYVSYAGWALCGTANSAGEAMRKAEAFLYAR